MVSAWFLGWGWCPGLELPLLSGSLLTLGPKGCSKWESGYVGLLGLWYGRGNLRQVGGGVSAWGSWLASLQFHELERTVPLCWSQCPRSDCEGGELTPVRAPLPGEGCSDARGCLQH